MHSAVYAALSFVLLSFFQRPLTLHQMLTLFINPFHGSENVLCIQFDLLKGFFFLHQHSICTILFIHFCIREKTRSEKKMLKWNTSDVFLYLAHTSLTPASIFYHSLEVKSSHFPTPWPAFFSRKHFIQGIVFILIPLSSLSV